ncbi:MAG TPA: class I SAM-dependent methyltransferase [Mycobacteriales bacterium]|nr:class I SAM-dependent methyltransferase [Mycobacteriales bacterium]
MGADADTRFAFGENWRDFSSGIGAEQVTAAQDGIRRLLGTDDLTGKTFLDVGCGSGLMSLAAAQMGAAVTAFDYDADSVATSLAVRDAAGGASYPVLRGSALDADFVGGLGQFDVVYSWGVLHHTGDLWGACEVVAKAVAPKGLLALAIYNDQGRASRSWTAVKKSYVEGGQGRRRLLVQGVATYFAARTALSDVAALRGGVGAVRQKRAERRVARPRGMDARHDLIDWVGGYPFEVAKPEEVFAFFRDRGFTLENLTTCGGGLGCNEFLFRRA